MSTDTGQNSDTMQIGDSCTLVQIIDSGTITQESTDNFPGPSGPSGPPGTIAGSIIIDAGTITQLSTDDLPTTLPGQSWPWCWPAY
jgi:hypothetical protein